MIYRIKRLAGFFYRGYPENKRAENKSPPLQYTPESPEGDFKLLLSPL
jgi:hypothetical protein